MKNFMLPYKISFVVIARNESFIIRRCINSVIECGESLLDYEIIFVDSLSDDGTLQKLMDIKNEKITILQITTKPNAAKARNVGSKYAQFEYFFFVDGDVEISCEFVRSALNEMVNSHEIGCVHGQLEELQYAIDYKRIVRVIKDRSNIKKKNVQEKLSGGIFLTKRNIFQKLRGFDERFAIKEDIDFMLRLMRGNKILCLPKRMGTHHTIPYRSTERTKEILFSSYNLYLGMLLRKHIICPDRIWFIMKAEYGLFLGGLFWPLLFLSILSPYILIKIIFGFYLIGDLLLGFKKEPENLSGRFISHYIFPICTLFGFLFYFPRRKKVGWKIVDH